MQGYKTNSPQVRSLCQFRNTVTLQFLLTSACTILLALSDLSTSLSWLEIHSHTVSYSELNKGFKTVFRVSAGNTNADRSVCKYHLPKQDSVLCNKKVCRFQCELQNTPHRARVMTTTKANSLISESQLLYSCLSFHSCPSFDGLPELYVAPALLPFQISKCIAPIGDEHAAVNIWPLVATPPPSKHAHELNSALSVLSLLELQHFLRPRLHLVGLI